MVVAVAFAVLVLAFEVGATVAGRHFFLAYSILAFVLFAYSLIGFSAPPFDTAILHQMFLIDVGKIFYPKSFRLL